MSFDSFQGQMGAFEESRQEGCPEDYQQKEGTTRFPTKVFAARAGDNENPQSSQHRETA